MYSQYITLNWNLLQYTELKLTAIHWTGTYCNTLNWNLLQYTELELTEIHWTGTSQLPLQKIQLLKT